MEDLKKRLQIEKNLPKDEINILRTEISAKEIAISAVRNEISAKENAITAKENAITAIKSMPEKEKERLALIQKLNTQIRVTKKQSQILAQYQKIGKSLYFADQTIHLRDKFREARDLAHSDQPFYVIDAPSGSGKTQLPYAIESEDLPVIHLIMAPSGGDRKEQPIYEVFQKKSALFRECLNYDLKYVRDCLESDDYLFSDPLLTATFLLHEFGVEITSDESYTFQDLRDFITMADKRKLPLIFLDEVLSRKSSASDTQDEENRLRLARYVIKRAGLVLILMGTNSHAVNMVKAAKYSRGWSNETPWAYLITKLPKATDESRTALSAPVAIQKLREYPQLSNFFTEQFKTCIPWFVAVFIDVMLNLEEDLFSIGSPVISTCDLFTRIIKDMASIVYKRKSLIRTGVSGLRAQLSLHLDAHRVRTEEYDESENLLNRRKGTAEFVSDHFASLTYADAAALYLREDGYLYEKSKSGSNDEKTFKAVAYFPRAKDNSLLYLMLGGGKEKFPTPFLSLTDKNKRISSRCAYETVNDLLPDLNLNPTNTKALSRNGVDLEAFLAIAIEIASHQNGFSGIELEDFLRYLVSEFLSVYRVPEWAEKNKLEMILERDLLDHTVPYLSSSNDEWPENIFSIEGCNFGNLERPANSERLDFRVTGYGISGEAKNYENVIDGQILSGMLKRCPSDSRVHLVIINSPLQSDYFTEKGNISWPEFRASNDLEDTAVVKVGLRNNGKLELVRLFPAAQMDKACSKAIVFLSVDDFWD